MRYFVTGATGFIGGELVRQLRVAGHTVAALVRDPAKAQSLAAQGVELFRGDITECAGLRPAMENSHGVFHVAAWYQLGGDTRLAERINVEGTRNVLETMRDLGIPKGVYTSTLAVFSDTGGRVVDETFYQKPERWISEYDRTKWLAHYEVALPMMQAGLPLVIVQPGVVYGPGDRSAMGDTFRLYLQRQLPMIPGAAAFAWAYVEDVARGHILAMEKGTPGESYILAGPVHTLPEAMQIAESITGVPAPRIRLPRRVTLALAAVAGLVERITPLPATFAAESLRAGAATYTASNAKARRELGYNPRSLEEGFRQTLLKAERKT